jgi:hypothetical protein
VEVFDCKTCGFSGDSIMAKAERNNLRFEFGLKPAFEYGLIPRLKPGAIEKDFA